MAERQTIMTRGTNPAPARALSQINVTPGSQGDYSGLQDVSRGLEHGAQALTNINALARRDAEKARLMAERNMDNIRTMQDTSTARMVAATDRSEAVRDQSDERLASLKVHNAISAHSQRMTEYSDSLLGEDLDAEQRQKLVKDAIDKDWNTIVLPELDEGKKTLRNDKVWDQFATQPQLQSLQAQAQAPVLGNLVKGVAADKLVMRQEETERAQAFRHGDPNNQSPEAIMEVSMMENADAAANNLGKNYQNGYVGKTNQFAFSGLMINAQHKVETAVSVARQLASIGQLTNAQAEDIANEFIKAKTPQFSASDVAERGKQVTASIAAGIVPPDAMEAYVSQTQELNASAPAVQDKVIQDLIVTSSKASLLPDKQGGIPLVARYYPPDPQNPASADLQASHLIAKLTSSNPNDWMPLVEPLYQDGRNNLMKQSHAGGKAYTEFEGAEQGNVTTYTALRDVLVAEIGRQQKKFQNGEGNEIYQHFPSVKALVDAGQYRQAALVTQGLYQYHGYPTEQQQLLDPEVVKGITSTFARGSVKDRSDTMMSAIQTYDTLGSHSLALLSARKGEGFSPKLAALAYTGSMAIQYNRGEGGNIPATITSINEAADFMTDQGKLEEYRKDPTFRLVEAASKLRLTGNKIEGMSFEDAVASSEGLTTEDLQKRATSAAANSPMQMALDSAGILEQVAFIDQGLVLNQFKSTTGGGGDAVKAFEGADAIMNTHYLPVPANGGFATDKVWTLLQGAPTTAVKWYESPTHGGAWDQSDRSRQQGAMLDMQILAGYSKTKGGLGWAIPQIWNSIARTFSMHTDAPFVSWLPDVNAAENLDTLYYRRFVMSPTAPVATAVGMLPGSVPMLSRLPTALEVPFEKLGYINQEGKAVPLSQHLAFEHLKPEIAFAMAQQAMTGFSGEMTDLYTRNWMAASKSVKKFNPVTNSYDWYLMSDVTDVGTAGKPVNLGGGVRIIVIEPEQKVRRFDPKTKKMYDAVERPTPLPMTSPAEDVQDGVDKYQVENSMFTVNYRGRPKKQ